MNYLLFLIVGILPSIIWLVFYLRRDKNPEPNRLILQIFLWGMLATIPAIILELAIQCGFVVASTSFSFTECVDRTFSPLGGIPLAPFYNVLYMFLGIALVEELLKFAIIRWKIYKSKELDEAIDLPLYMIISALGFAALENILILSGLGATSRPEDIFILGMFRFVGATFLHALVSGMFGYFLVLSYTSRTFRIGYFIIGLSLATVLHALFNLYIIEVALPEKIIYPASIIVGLAIFLSFALTKLRGIRLSKIQVN